MHQYAPHCMADWYERFIPTFVRWRAFKYEILAPCLWYGSWNSRSPWAVLVLCWGARKYEQVAGGSRTKKALGQKCMSTELVWNHFPEFILQHILLNIELFPPPTHHLRLLLLSLSCVLHSFVFLCRMLPFRRTFYYRCCFCCWRRQCSVH